MHTASSVLVTGCAGFIGSHLTEQLLQRGYRVIGIDNFDPFYDRTLKEENLSNVLGHGQFHFIEADIQGLDWQSQVVGPVDSVIHIAAKAGVRSSIEAPAAYVQTNIVGTNNLLAWMQGQGVGKLVFASSSSVYGNNPKVPFSENDAVEQPISPYAFTKRAGELLTYNYHHLYQMSVVNLRFFTVFGERQRPDLAINKFVRMIAADQPVTMYGTGDTSRDYTYVGDIVTGILAAHDYVAAHPNTYEIINLGNSSPVSLQTLVDTLYDLMGKTPNIEYLPKQPGDVERTFADVAKATRLLQYQPTVSLREGLRRFIAWHEAKSL
ncbi:GDP-mannose 4,6-dehydratase [Fibrella sp. HMF5335]|uniref:GDP-mannose 4,6-dehydratase n=1 Tax=Fibrella rubiginis TaxID=2817060 RepID=A0A939GJX5_9BACT|nr:GDP-mannose 4,6-dehydratase [Fibrella rubiginis]MBO0938136.1 GDP-mannose 4,6-dehydratase [Fibrella rubiginis]